MKGADVIEIVERLNHGGVNVWLNGGWGIAALLGKQTRDHNDLDITVPASQRGAFDTVMGDMGFSVSRVDNDFNWVLVDATERVVDVHLVDLDETTIDKHGKAIYGPRGLAFDVGSLEGTGIIEGKSVRCETAEFQVHGHTTYTPDENDYCDVLALCTRFGVAVPQIFIDLGFHRPQATL